MKIFDYRSALLITAFALLSCSHSTEKSPHVKTSIYIAVPHKLTSTLYYSGTIQPISASLITSPADGVIDGVTFHYGDKVTAGQALFNLVSEKFLSDYKTALMQYIKSKTEFTTSQTKLKESEFLHKNQLISDDDFKTAHTDFYNTQLSFAEARESLTVLIKQLQLPKINVYDLTIQDITKITDALHIEGGTRKLHIMTPIGGIALYPTKSEGSDGETKKLMKGDSVKQGDVLARIGDVNGFAIHIDVNEININQLKIGQAVKVTGLAFPDTIMTGFIAAFDRVGQVGQNGIPTFPVEITIPHLTEAQQKIIHVGMSAKVEVSIDSAEVLTVPLAAVKQADDHTYLLIKKPNRIEKTFIKTGQTTPDSVVVEEGLQAGDKVIVDS